MRRLQGVIAPGVMPHESEIMSNAIDDRVLALAGVLQALAQVRRIADTGQSEAAPVEVALASVLRLDADTTEAVYGDAQGLRKGLGLLRDHLANNPRDEALGKLALAVLQLERRFSRDDAMAAKVGAGIASAAQAAGERGAAKVRGRRPKKREQARVLGFVVGELRQ